MEAPSCMVSERQPTRGIGWLVRLRWGAVMGQWITVVVVSQWMEIRIPEISLYVLIGLIGLSNGLILHRGLSRWTSRPWVPPLILGFDLVVFSSLLALTGGRNNPFVVFYLVHLTIIPILTRGPTLVGLLALAAAGFAVNCFWFQPLNMPYTHAGGLDSDIQLQGRLVATVLAAGCVVWFVSSVNRELRRREFELATAREDLARNEFFRSLATLAAGVAHELNTPLGTIAIAAGELNHRLRQDAASNSAIEDAALIRAEVQRCRVILDRLNHRTTAEIGDPPEAVRVQEILDAALAATPTAELGRLQLDVATAPEWITVARMPLTQSLAAVLRNAIDAAPEGLITLAVEQGDGLVRFVVSDQGMVLTREACERMTRAFYTTKGSEGGMGLGLFLVKTFADRSGGSLSIVPNHPRGACVSLSLPLAPVSSAP